MDFSEPFPFNGKGEFSHDGKHIATADKSRIFVRDTESLEIVHVFTCLDATSVMSWSPDSQYLMCAQYKRRVVQVWSMQDPEWVCKLDEGLAGLSHACWSPDGCNILTSTEFQLRRTIWSLTNKSIHYIQFPKFSDKGYDFSNDGKFMVMAERKDFKDFLGIYHTRDWKLVKHFQVETEDMTDVKWAPDDRYIAAWDSCLEYRLVIYTPDGRKIHQYQAYEHALGIKHVQWSPSGNFLAVGSYDEVCRLFNNVTWKPLGEHNHPSPLTKDSGAVIYHERLVDKNGEELEMKESITGRKSALPVPGNAPSKYAIAQTPFAVPQLIPPVDVAEPKMGVGIVKFSADDLYMATVNENMPTTVWVWDIQKLALCSVLSHRKPIKSIMWDPCRHRMCISTSNSKLYLWSPEGCSIVDVPLPDFIVRKAEWSPDGNSLLLMDKTTFCCCYLVPEASDEA